MSTLRYPKVVIQDISDWDEKLHISHYGKRLKDVYENSKSPGRYSYFKQSDERYPWEFWNEVIASRLAAMFDIPCAVYNPAVLHNHSENQDLWGCLSQLLHKPSEEFKHGQEFLLQEKPGFDIHKGTDHNYHDIMIVLKNEGLSSNDILLFHKMLVFDTLIGNRDRHQENWAIISSQGNFFLGIENYHGKGVYKLVPNLSFDGKSFGYEDFKRLSPMYDNGTSLGHNLTEKGIIDHLNQEDTMKKYVSGPKAQSHVRWKGKKLRHFDLLKNISEESPALMMQSINTILDNFSPARIKILLTRIDKEYDHSNLTFRLTNERKDFIYRLLLLRTQKLAELRTSLT